VTGTIHITNGHSAAGPLRQALRNSRCLVLVHEGWLSYVRVPADRCTNLWRQQRDAYVERYDDEDSASHTWDRSLLYNLDKLQSARQISLWIGPNLEDQLLLAWLIQLLKVVGIDISSLVVKYCGRYSKAGYIYSPPGVLSADDFQAVPSGLPLTAQQVAELDEAWTAITARDPLDLAAFANRQASANPCLLPALKALMHRYPAVGTGLNDWEDLLMYYVTKKIKKSVSHLVGYTMAHDLDWPDWAGSDYLIERILRLADPQLPHPYLQINGPEAHRLSGPIECQYIGMRSELTVTEAGRNAEADEANFVKLNGIDEWIGGVHLDSKSGSVWFRNGERFVKTDLR